MRITVAKSKPFTSFSGSDKMLPTAQQRAERDNTAEGIKNILFAK